MSTSSLSGTAATPSLSGTPTILYHCGGFAHIGGVETHVAELIKAMPAEVGRRNVVLWGKPASQSPKLAEIQAVADKCVRSPWRWGCRFGWPDRLLLPIAKRMAAHADLILYPKIMPLWVHVAMRSVRREGRGQPPASVGALHYRPAELWPRGVDPAMWKCFDVMVVQASSFADDLRTLGYQGRIEMIANISEPPPPLRALPPRVDGKVRLGFLGRLVAQKNIDYMLEIFDHLQQISGPQFELNLFGDGTERARLEQIVAASPSLSRSVQFKGPVHGQGKWDAIDSCEIFLNTGLTEGQPLVSLEVLGRGRPLVATAVGALPEMLNVPTLGALLPVGAAKHAAEILADAVARWRAGEMSPHAIQEIYSQRYGHDKIVQKYAQLFQELISAN